MENRITVSEAIWQWVIQSIALPQLKADIRDKIVDWASGKKAPTFNQLEKLSKETRIPLGYFFLNQPPTESCSVLEYRTLDSKELESPSRDLLDTVRQMEDIQEWMRDFLISASVDTNRYVGSIHINDGLDKAVESIRAVLSLNSNWYIHSKSSDASFKTLRTAISNAGVLVMQNGVVGGNTHRSLDLNEFRAFSLIDSFVPLIFINAKDSPAGKLFSLLHEFVHIGVGEGNLLNMGDWHTWNNVSPLETFCNKVVAEILVPENDFHQAWANAAGDVETKVSRLAAQFRCSHSVIVRKCLENKFISQSDYTKLQSKARHLAQKTNKSGGGDYWPTLLSRADHRFLKALESSINEGRTPYTEAFRLTNTNLSTFEPMMQQVRGGLA